MFPQIYEVCPNSQSARHAFLHEGEHEVQSVKVSTLCQGDWKVGQHPTCSDYLSDSRCFLHVCRWTSSNQLTNTSWRTPIHCVESVMHDHWIGGEMQVKRAISSFTGFVHLLEHMGDPWSDPYPEYRSLIECVYIMWVRLQQLKYLFMKSVTMAFQLNIPTPKILKVRDSWLWRVLSGRLCGQGVCLPLHDGLSWHGLIGSSWGKHWGQQWRTKIPPKLEVAPPPKCGLDGWVMGDTP